RGCTATAEASGLDDRGSKIEDSGHLPSSIFYPRPKNCSPPCDSLKLPHQPNHLAQDAEFSGRDGDRSIFFVLRFEGDDAVFFIETLQGRFALDQGADDLAVLRRPLLLHNHTVAIQDAGADHAVSFDLEGEKLS